MRHNQLWIYAGAAALALALVGIWFALPVEDWLSGFTRWVRTFGVAGGLVFGAIFLIGTLVLVPPSVLFIAAGLLYGLGWGFVASWAGAVACGAVAFLIARYLARERIAALVGRHPTFAALDQAVREEGWKVVLLLRASPLVPGTLQNYAFGLTGVRLRAWLPGTALGVVPWALLFAWLGSLGSVVLARGTDEALGPWQWAFMAGGVVMVSLMVWLVGRRARARLRELGLNGGGPSRSP